MSEANEAHGVYIHDTDTDTVEFVEYTKVKVVSIPYDKIDQVHSYDPANTTIRIEYPDDLEDENIIEEHRQSLEDRGFYDVKSKYKGRKLKELLENSSDVEEIENIDEFVVKSLKTMSDVDRIDNELLAEIYQKAIVLEKSGVEEGEYE
jgi:hypothetical protein